MLQADPNTQVIDVRTLAEWNFVGLPDLSSLGRQVQCVEWQTYPTMQPNLQFATDTADAMTALGVGPQTPLLFLCRSGARSRAAAIAMTRAGFHKAFNIAGGFEGELDPQGHRGHLSGWKAAGLPWRQN